MAHLWCLTMVPTQFGGCSMSVRALLVLLMGGFVLAGYAQGPRLLVVNQGDKTISVVDPATNKQVSVIDQQQTTMHGHEIAVGGDGKTVYMPVYGNVGVGAAGL